MKTALRPLLVLAFALATLVSTQAQAAVPMCSSDGRSVIAPPIVLPWRMLTLDAPQPCPTLDHFFVQSLPNEPQRSPSAPPTPAPLRAVPVRHSELASSARTRATITTLAAPPGIELVHPPDRPPRA